jgi:hypothetical protein
MEPAQANPVKKRRRWLIAALVLVLVSGVAWNWPCGDARFVGKWRLTFENQDGSLNAESGHVLIFHRNGRGEVFDNRSGVSQSFAWIIRGNHYIEGSPTSNAFLNDMMERIWSWLPTSVTPAASFTGECQIGLVSENSIELKSGDGRVARVIFTRIPE